MPSKAGTKVHGFKREVSFMPTNNFQIFDENMQNMMGDGDYSVSSRRLNGVQTGIASSQLQNKTLFQTSVMAKALADLLNDFGHDVTDSSYSDISAALIKELSYGKEWHLLQAYTSSGSYTYTVPAGTTKLGVFIIGGGAGGGIAVSNNSISSSYINLTGGSGETKAVIIDSPSASYNVVVGSGGAGASFDGTVSGETKYKAGSNGNSSAFGSYTANGGTTVSGASVNNQSDAFDTIGVQHAGQGFIYRYDYSTFQIQSYENPLMCINPFDSKKTMLSGSYPVSGYTKISDTQYVSTAVQYVITDDYGNISSKPAYTVYYQNVSGTYDALPASAEVGTSYGCGGSPAIAHNLAGASNRQYKLDGASGCSGAVLIYAR